MAPFRKKIFASIIYSQKGGVKNFPSMASAFTQCLQAADRVSRHHFFLR